MRNTFIAVRVPALIAAVAVVWALLAQGASPASAHHLCPNTGSAAGPFSFQTYEDGNYRSTYGRTFELAGHNRLFPEIPAFVIPAMESGPRSSGSVQGTSGFVPPVLLKAIAWMESGWAQADYSVPYGALGPALVSHDCGYGLAQVTTGMQNISGVPNAEQSMIGGHYAFNIARGAQILVSKWNLAPEYRPIVGSRDPHLLEDWYYALWGYNGFAFKNHPLNGFYSPGRAPFSCGPENDGFGHDRSQYPYQELVLGCAARPPVRLGTPLWNPQPVHLPDLNDPAFAGPLNVAHWNACSFSADCAVMDMPTPGGPHQDPTAPPGDRSQVIGSPRLLLSRTGVDLRIEPGTASASTDVSLANIGTGVMSWRATSTAGWLRASAYQGVSLGTDLGSRQSSLTITADASGLPPGRHTAVINIESLATAGAPATITVTVETLPNGSLLRGSGPHVYLLVDGARRHIPDQATFEASGFDWGRVVVISDSVLNSLPTTVPLLSVLADGNLLKGSGNEVYVMMGGARRHVANEAVFQNCGYGWDSLKRVSDGTIRVIPSTAQLTGGQCPRLIPPDGMTVKGPGADVYVMAGGFKRHLPDLATLDARGLRWSDINPLTSSEISWVPTGSRLLSALTQGSLVKGPGPEVFVMDNGARRHIANEGVLATCGYGASQIYHVSGATLQSLPTGAGLGGSPCPKFVPPSGQLLKGSGPQIYLVQEGIKRHIPNEATFSARGYRFANVDTVDDRYVTNLPIGHSVVDVLAQGNLLQGTGPSVYVMHDGFKRHVLSEGAFNACGYRWDAIQRIAGGPLAGIPTGTPLAVPPCPGMGLPTRTLLKGFGPEVYVIQDGRKRHITSQEAFNACGYHWGNIDYLLDGVIASIPSSSPLASAPCP